MAAIRFIDVTARPIVESKSNKTGFLSPPIKRLARYNALEIGV